ncbi:MAG TPA: hypothetical protein VKF59_19490 [Candidatus Dormibacteraeota bacterium]|nr:hypothetical protein [Candidatus Dormibacteraeota bacterium]
MAAREPAIGALPDQPERRAPVAHRVRRRLGRAADALLADPRPPLGRGGDVGQSAGVQDHAVDALRVGQAEVAVADVGRDPLRVPQERVAHPRGESSPVSVHRAPGASTSHPTCETGRRHTDAIGESSARPTRQEPMTAARRDARESWRMVDPSPLSVYLIRIERMRRRHDQEGAQLRSGPCLRFWPVVHRQPMCVHTCAAMRAHKRNE